MQSRLRGLRICNHLRTDLKTSRNLSSKPELTSVRYQIDRGAYAALSNTHVSFFENLLGKNRTITDVDGCDAYNIDWIKTVRGKQKSLFIFFKNLFSLILLLQ